MQGSRQMLQTIYIYSTQHLHYSYFNAKSLSIKMSVINTHGSNSSQASLLHTPVTSGPARHQTQQPHAKVSEHRDTLTASQTASSLKMFQNTWRTVHTANLVPQVRHMSLPRLWGCSDGGLQTALQFITCRDKESVSSCQLSTYLYTTAPTDLKKCLDRKPAEALGVRVRAGESKSTCTMPKRCVYPSSHSKLSIRLHAK